MNKDDIDVMWQRALRDAIKAGGKLARYDFAAFVAAAEREKYNELLMAVGKKFPGESRHETALRYIREAESKSDCAEIRARGEEK